jgi:hypothetical protein
MYTIDLFQYKFHFHYAFNVNPGNQGSRYNFLFKIHKVLETGFCLCLQLEPTQLGPVDGASPCLRRQNPVSKNLCFK